jgi:hypothetical protein
MSAKLGLSPPRFPNRLNVLEYRLMWRIFSVEREREGKNEAEGNS